MTATPAASFCNMSACESHVRALLHPSLAYYSQVLRHRTGQDCAEPPAPRSATRRLARSFPMTLPAYSVYSYLSHCHLLPARACRSTAAARQDMVGSALRLHLPVW